MQDYCSGESFETYTGEEIFPVVTSRQDYTLVIYEYSDEVYKFLHEQIIDNNYITIGGADYIVPVQSLEPNWDSFSHYGYIEIPITLKDSIKKTKRNQKMKKKIPWSRSTD